MGIEFDQDKRNTTLRERGLDFARAGEILAGPVLTKEDARYDYGERRFVTFGQLDCRIVVLVWTKRGALCRIISMRYANDREKSQYSKSLG